MKDVRLLRLGRLGAAGLALIGTLAVAPGFAVGADAGEQVDAAVKAAFLFNFARFAEWTALPPAAPIIVCIVGDDEVAAALVEIVRGQTIGGHALDTWRPVEAKTWRSCHMLYTTAAEIRAGGGVSGLSTLPVLTVSDRKGFAQSGGIIELYVEAERVRFAINVDALERSGLRLSSRLLGLAKVIRDPFVH